jgi:hypothetical protein
MKPTIRERRSLKVEMLPMPMISLTINAITIIEGIGKTMKEGTHGGRVRDHRRINLRRRKKLEKGETDKDLVYYLFLWVKGRNVSSPFWLPLTPRKAKATENA